MRNKLNLLININLKFYLNYYLITIYIISNKSRFLIMKLYINNISLKILSFDFILKFTSLTSILFFLINLLFILIKILILFLILIINILKPNLALLILLRL